MADKLFAIYSIKRTRTPAVQREDAFGKVKTVKPAVTYYIVPGTLFEPLDDDEAKDLIRLGAARAPTAAELRLDENGLLIGAPYSAGAVQLDAEALAAQKARVEQENAALAAHEAAVAAAAAATAQSSDGKSTDAKNTDDKPARAALV